MTKTRLLIVDDDEDICTQMKLALRNDYELLTAGDRAGALVLLGHKSIEAIVAQTLSPPRRHSCRPIVDVRRRGSRRVSDLLISYWPTVRCASSRGMRLSHFLLA
jgi:DNA-binding NtrC family response regulator